MAEVKENFGVLNYHFFIFQDPKIRVRYVVAHYTKLSLLCFNLAPLVIARLIVVIEIPRVLAISVKGRQPHGAAPTKHSPTAKKYVNPNGAA